MGEAFTIKIYTWVFCFCYVHTVTLISLTHSHSLIIEDVIRCTIG